MNAITHTEELAVNFSTSRGIDRAQSLGAIGEEVACQHLRQWDGFEVVARNWRVVAGELRGELDVVALDHAAGLIVVCEVKTRRNAAHFGGALSAVSPSKRAKVRALAGCFLREASLPFTRTRLDVIAIDVGNRTVLTHVPDAL